MKKSTIAAEFPYHRERSLPTITKPFRRARVLIQLAVGESVAWEGFTATYPPIGGTVILSKLASAPNTVEPGSVFYVLADVAIDIRTIIPVRHELDDPFQPWTAYRTD